MNKNLESALSLVEESKHLTDEEKKSITKSILDADKELEITAFKLERTEKVKRTTAILLEETIEELEKKRKAVEEQKRELEIETALEKVRSRTMAMQHSDELTDVASLLFNQISALGIKTWTAGFNVWSEDNNSYVDYLSFGEGFIEPNIVHTEKAEALRDVSNARKSGVEFHVLYVEGEKIKQLYLALGKIDEKQYGILLKDGIVPSQQYEHFVFGSKVSLMFITYDPVPEAHHIFKRFGIVFEQTYTRFLDLQKAEAQARESQIQLALERVRARTMAMHYSTELADTATILFQQIKELGFEIWSCGFGIWKPEVDLEEAWMSTGDSFPIILIPFKDDPTHLSIYEASQRGESVFEIELKGEVLTRHYDWLMSQPSFKIGFSQIENSEIILPTVQWKYAAFFKQGYLHLITTKPQPNIHDISNRFAKVFEQTYTRFLDLQKVEAQVREAMIEASLERIRSHSMALQKSADLEEVIKVVFTEWKKLGLDIFESNINIVDHDNKAMTIWSYGLGYTDSIKGTRFQFFDHPFLTQFIKDFRNQTQYSIIEMSGENNKDYLRKAFTETDLKYSPEEYKQALFAIDKVFISNAFIKFGSMDVISLEPLPEDKAEILIRFAKVFEQTYTRFLDLQKAEAQAKEAQIQLSLERIRAKAMAMQHSDELSDFLTVLFEQFDVLNLNPIYSHLTFFDIDNNRSTYRMTGKKGSTLIATQEIDLDASPVWQQEIEEWKAGHPNDVDVIYIPFESLPEITEIFKEILEKLLEDERPLPEDFPNGQYVIQGYCKYGYLGYSAIQPPSDEEKEITRRIATEFGNVYQRFLDLQKAEAQSREAQIQLALERVRARTMAMHHSDELSEVSYLLNKQVVELGIHTWGCAFNIYNENDSIEWFSNLEGTIPAYHTPRENIFLKYYEAGQRGESLLIEEFAGERIKELYKYFASLNDSENETITNHVAKAPDYQINHMAYFKYGYLLFVTFVPAPEAHDIFKRFAKEFEQTYTRFLDLQKAEAQAREAEIETALERVRSRTMGMQKSAELGEVAVLLYNELKILGVTQQFFETGYMEIDEVNNIQTGWTTTPDGNYLEPFNLPLFGEPVLDARYEAWKQRVPVFKQLVSGEELKRTIEFSLPYMGNKEAEEITRNAPDSIIFYCGNFEQGYLTINSDSPMGAEAEAVLARFTRVFEQTYTRFKDLEKAEAQSREAQIEAALERVRSRTMAMQRSEELPEVAALLFQQVKSLGVPQFQCGFNIFEIDDKECTWYPGSADGDILPPCKIPLTEHPIFMNFIDSRKRGDELFVYEKEGEYQASHYRYMLSLPVLGEILQNMLDAGIPFPTFQIDHLANFSHGNLLFITSEHFPEMHETFKRFAKVFEQTYTRFLDLQKAEAQALEAIKRASVDRVRAEIASMRTTADLERITPIIWSELTTLGVPFIRCGVFIMDEEQQQVQSFLSTPDGNALAAFTQPYSSSGETAQIVISWHKKEIYKQHWDEAQFAEFTNSLLEQGAVKSGEKYLIENRPTDLYLHFLPFMQGMLYVGNTAVLSDDELQLMQNLADAFSTAYARYEDFNQLEAAKGQIEKTLVDLKQAQTQLIQSEKMASLGELTAGIAHEIQNPLNFVNNFSEVSTEMIDEMNEELAKGDLEEAKAISEDLKQNLIKINHHGNRASSIVKGMLEHSRTSSKDKQLTDINLLADEYLRLSYHGLRAKDKSFNADFQLLKDDNLPKIEVIPQDIGRVLLNLINNAFQAPVAPSGGAKRVVVRTKFIAEANFPLNRRGGDEVHISIKDNGSGIPKANLEKIFQPFFTTKPTGQGTGLGLSLAYDIVTKGHGGTIEVESEEGVGTEFIVKLPI